MTGRLTSKDLSILFLAMIVPCGFSFLYFFVFQDKTLIQITYFLSKIYIFAFPSFFVFYLKKGRILFSFPKMIDLKIGLSMGVLISISAIAMYLTIFKGSPLLEGSHNAILTKISKFNADSPLGFIAVTFFISVINASIEEYYWRWFIFGQFRKSFGFYAAALLSSLSFIFHHIVTLSFYLPTSPYYLSIILLSVFVGIGGFIWCYIYEKTGSLWGVWLSHFLIDCGLMIVGFDILWNIF